MIEDGDRVEDDDGLDPLYPDAANTCSHKRCEQEAFGPDRLCDDCLTIMLSENSDICPHCKTTYRKFA